jgi:hypothetical protein
MKRKRNPDQFILVNQLSIFFFFGDRHSFSNTAGPKAYKLFKTYQAIMEQDNQLHPTIADCGSENFKSKVSLKTLQSIYLNMSSHWNEDQHTSSTLYVSL